MENRERSTNIRYQSIDDKDLDAAVVDPQVSCIRWYVITVVSLANVLNTFLWATWGPIFQSAHVVYGWSDIDVFWIVNIGNIVSFIFVFFGVYLVDCKGIRISMVICTVLMSLVTTSRIITLHNRTATILIGVGQGLNGIANSITLCTPTVVSQTWFRATERTTATAVSTLAFALGAAAAFLFGPLTVSMPKLNGTEILVNETDVSLIKSQMMELHYTSFGLSIFLMLCCIIYLPSKPSTAPSKTANIDRYTLKVGICQLLKNPSVWCIAAVYSIPLGFAANLPSILDVLLSPFGISQADAGWMNFYGSIAGVVVGVLLSRFVDRIHRITKTVIVLLYICTAVNFTIFTLMCVKILPQSKVAFYATIIIGGIISNSSMPLFMEITCEASYPVAEGVTGGFLGMMINLGATVFLTIDLIPNVDVSWANWALVGVYTAAIPLMMCYKAKYKRIDIDIITDLS